MKKKKVHFILPSTKGSMNACMELMGFSASNKVKNHWNRFNENEKCPKMSVKYYITEASSEITDASMSK